ncbi:MAG: heavy-metal-associated domain-containing protein [Alistipes sp.]|nr:heavy-metal-associated domain-containing protein [Alistipes sp.]
MKKILLCCLVALMSTGICLAAKPDAKQTTKTTVFATDIHCDHCANKIMNNVPTLGKGIKDVQIDVPTKEVTVVYDATKNSDDNIIKGFAKLKVKAEPKQEKK